MYQPRIRAEPILGIQEKERFVPDSSIINAVPTVIEKEEVVFGTAYD